MIGSTQAVAQFSDVFFIDDLEGWITVIDFSSSTSDSAVILHTEDGGETWKIQTPPSNCQTIWMLDKNTGYAGSTDGRIYKTTDGGDNWLFHSIPAGYVMDIAFSPSEEIGYAVVDQSSYLYKISSDTLEKIPLNGPNFWASVSCPAANEVWFVGGASLLFYNGDTLVYSNANAGGYHSCILFENSSLGWISNEVYAQGYYAPKDSWVALTILEEPSTDMCNIGEDHLWVVGYNGLLINTHNAKDFKRLDNGQAEINVVWESPEHPLNDARFLSIHASSVNNVFVVGKDKAIMKYSQVSGVGEEKEFLQFDIFPNPASDKLNVKSKKFRAKVAMIEIYDLNGRKLIEKQIPKGMQTIEVDVSNLESGVYLLVIKTNAKISLNKLIVRK